MHSQIAPLQNNNRSGQTAIQSPRQPEHPPHNQSHFKIRKGQSSRFQWQISLPQTGCQNTANLHSDIQLHQGSLQGSLARRRRINKTIHRGHELRRDFVPKRRNDL